MDENLPPVLPTLQEEIEEYLTDIESLPIHDSKHFRCIYPSYPQPIRLLIPSLNPVTSCLEVSRDSTTGEITGVNEYLNLELGCTAKNSFSLGRLPGPIDETVRGSTTNFPFWPGGIPEPVLEKKKNDIDLLNPKNYFSKHPKLSKGLIFNDEDNAILEPKTIPNTEFIELTDMLKVDEKVLNIFNNEDQNSFDDKTAETKLISDETNLLMKEVVLESNIKKYDVIPISEGPKPMLKGTEWAEVVDINKSVDNFADKIPNPACKYPFELDTFQKQAILHLENGDNVFVAAHTSAGKTVVAEYCIGLALKHMTKAIYTSPIKALSNQKYRELKIKFEDVGLLTGDIQINAKASCLIMTTEILQSMLYNGSDTIRDLEWVIFDEVHYINDIDRGHVWEEVIIMLPSHVHIVLLSATVPNTVEFADWIGRIKKRKIYVVSTTRRPVPLEHYLYTGQGGKSKDDRFMLVDSNEKFLMKGYDDAILAKQDKGKKDPKTQDRNQKSSKIVQKNKPNMYSSNNPKSEMNTYIGLIDHLSRNDLLPVVAFTLSKKRCDQNALQLMSQDLTTKKEKGEIHSFIKKCMDRLQDADKCLRQVVHMKELLERGIGVHHSGILPILKEVVEMLFARGLVKILFATETFAMGVNMPARCVVFDSIKKHDGIEFRTLLPSEYIQMAGRAGRRGHDTTGTVIILCKMDVPDSLVLKNMMLGKPTQLKSQFKLTYSMILNLLKVESLRVEDMIKSSFSESFLLKNFSNYMNELKLKERDLDDAPQLECLMCADLKMFYSVSKDYVSLRKDLCKILWTHPNAKKKLQPGRLVVISYENYQNYLACIIAINQKTFTVFVLVDKKFSDYSSDSILASSYIHSWEGNVYIIDKTIEHKLIDIDISDIINISQKSLNIDPARITKNIREREIPRFKGNPPGQSVMEVITELQRILEAGPEALELVDIQKDLGVKDINTVEKLFLLNFLRAKLKSHSCLECPQFKEHFVIAYKRLKILDDINKLKFKMSEEALKLHPEYKMRVEVLKMLGYIEHNNVVTLKGRVACEMGNHELMLTELLLQNILTDRSIEEIAALLSSLVFQQRYCSEPSLTKDLQNGIKLFNEAARGIGKAQKQAGLKESVEDFVEQFNFGLCEVVYQWSLGMPFNKIIELTDVQEGIIVKCIQRLDEILRDVKKAACIVGNPSLQEKMDKVSSSIKRDIVFAASLYVQ